MYCINRSESITFIVCFIIIISCCITDQKFKNCNCSIAQSSGKRYVLTASYKTNTVVLVFAIVFSNLIGHKEAVGSPIMLVKGSLLILGLVSVSYTHLDVYKRQE